MVKIRNVPSCLYAAVFCCTLFFLFPRDEGLYYVFSIQNSCWEFLHLMVLTYIVLTHLSVANRKSRFKSRLKRFNKTKWKHGIILKISPWSKHENVFVLFLQPRVCFPGYLSPFFRGTLISLMLFFAVIENNNHFVPNWKIK